MINRREALHLIGGGLLGGAVAGLAAPVQAATGGQGSWPWKARKLDPEEGRAMAYQGYYENGLGCGYGAFKGIIGLMAQKYGAPYNTFPMEMMSYGASGVSGWGTLCGALNGAAAAIGLFYSRKEQKGIINPLFTWYEQAALPVYKPAKPKRDFEIPTSVATSPLCHVSVGEWCQASGLESGSKQRSERCARVTGDVAFKAIELINAKLDGKLPAAQFSDSYKSCMKCHGKGGEGSAVKSKMDCVVCHDGGLMDMTKDHP